MQGIVLAIIISTLSPEGMNGATAALCLSAKALGLHRAPALLTQNYMMSISFKQQAGTTLEEILQRYGDVKLLH